MLLKKKRFLESLLTKTDQQLDNLQQMVDNIEFAQIEMRVVEGLKTGNECLEQLHKLMSIEDVEKIMEDTQDAIEYQRVRLIDCMCMCVCTRVCMCVHIVMDHSLLQEIDELLGQNLTQEDEDAVAEELESILLVGSHYLSVLRYVYTCTCSLTHPSNNKMNSCCLFFL